jgi:hypothetical protein
VDAPAPSALPVFGWREFVSLPDWDIARLRAKLDTGARTSALHVEDYEELDGAGAGTVRFHVLSGPRDAPVRTEVVAELVGHAVVRDTRARPEERPLVRTRLRCGPLDTTIDLSLTDRTGMNFRLLLGRRALAGHAVVDPSGSFLRSDPPRTGRRSSPPRAATSAATSEEA